MKALAEKEDWEELEKFAKSKKSPIGYLVGILYRVIFSSKVSIHSSLLSYLFSLFPFVLQPFVEVCMKHHNRHEAKKYVSKVTPEQKVKAHLSVG